MDQFATASFPQNVLHHSALRYLQELLTERCAALPVTFATLDAWQAYREGLVAFLRERLPIWTLEPTVPARRTGCFDLHDDLILEAIDVPFDRAYTIPVHLYRPRTPAEQRAVVLVCPGYGQEKNAATIADLCMALARAGILAVAIDYDATGERGDRPDFETGINNVTAVGQLLGITNVGLRVMNNLAALAYVRTREDVDPRAHRHHRLLPGGDRHLVHRRHLPGIRRRRPAVRRNHLPGHCPGVCESPGRFGAASAHMSSTCCVMPMSRTYWPPSPHARCSSRTISLICIGPTPAWKP